MSKASERQVGGSHYKDLPVQPGYYIRKNGLGWYEGNIIKYTTRHKQKGQREDILKVIHYAELILEEYADTSGKSGKPGKSGKEEDGRTTDEDTVTTDDTGDVREHGEFRSVRGNPDRGQPASVRLSFLSDRGDWPTPP